MLSMKDLEEPAAAPPSAKTPDPASFYVGGSIAERIDLQLGVLTQGVVDCMILSTGTCPSLTEGAPSEPTAWAKPAATQSTWQAARSAELRDAARLSEASARLVLGLAKLRGEFKQDFVVRHSSDGSDKRRQRTTISRRFSVPGNDAPAEADAEEAKTLDVNLRNLVQAMERNATKTEPGRPSRADMMAELMRRHRRARGEDKDDGTPQGAS